MLHRPRLPSSCQHRRSPPPASRRSSTRRKRAQTQRWVPEFFGSVRRTCPSSLPRFTGVIGGQVSHVLVVQRGRDAPHREVLARTALVVLQRLDDVGFLLLADLWDG